MKPEIKVGQVWYDDDRNDLVLIYNNETVAWSENIKDLICSHIFNYNFKDGNWHYIGEL